MHEAAINASISGMKEHPVLLVGVKPAAEKTRGGG